MSLCSGIHTGLHHEDDSSVRWVWSGEMRTTGEVWEVMGATTPSWVFLKRASEWFVTE